MTDNFRDSPADEEKFKFDALAHATTIILEEHRLIHDGMVYTAPWRQFSIPDDFFHNFLILTGDTPVHFKRLNIAASAGPVTVDFLEEPTVTTPGILLNPPLNLNRVSTRDSDSRLYNNPTLSADGNPLLGTLYVPGGDVETLVIGATALAEELILKPNTYYQIKINNPAGNGPLDAFVTGIFYEIGYEV